MLRHLKICGITDQKSLDICIQLNIGFIGFNFVPQSPRYISPEDSYKLQKKIPQSIAKVALCVNETDIIISNIIKHLKPDYLQLHGHESLERVQYLRSHFKIPIIKAIGIATNQDIETAVPYFEYADMMLFDAKPTDKDILTGGLGKQFNWSLVHNIKTLNKPFMLAGGLNIHNLKIAQQQSNANFFDICSGVEEIKGTKSIALLQQLAQLL